MLERWYLWVTAVVVFLVCFGAVSLWAWRRTNGDAVAMFTAALAAFSFLLIIVGAIQSHLIYRSVQASRDQLTLAFPPKIRVANISIWEKGRGEMFNRENIVPQLTEGVEIEGAVTIGNYGREAALIVQSDCKFLWLDEPPGMVNPLWARPTKTYRRIEVRLFDWKLDKPSDIKADSLPVGETGVWLMSDSVRPGKDLYVLGFVDYSDRLGTRHHTFFLRRFDAKAGRFVVVTDPDYEVYN